MEQEELAPGASLLPRGRMGGLPAWPPFTSDDPYFGTYKILSLDGHRITVR